MKAACSNSCKTTELMQLPCEAHSELELLSEGGAMTASVLASQGSPSEDDDEVVSTPSATGVYRALAVLELRGFQR